MKERDLRKKTAKTSATPVHRRPSRGMEQPVDSEQLVRALYESAPVAVIVWDRDCRVVEWSAGAQRMFGWNRDEVLGRNFFDFLIPENSRPQVGAVTELLLAGHLPSNNVNENLTKSGAILLCEWINSIRYDAAGQVTGALSIGTDITERRAAFETIRQTRELLTSVLNGSLDAIIALRTVRDPRGGVVDFEGILANPAAERLLGLSESRITDQRIRAMFPDAEGGVVFQRCVEALKSGDPQCFELAVAREGPVQWLQFVIVQLEGGVAVTIRDITAVRATDAALRESERKYRLLAEHSGDVIWTMDAQMRFTYVSPSVERVYGYAPGELLGVPLSNIVAPYAVSSVPHSAGDPSVLQAALEQLDAPIRREIEILCKTGEAVWTEVVANPVQDEQGCLTGFVGITRDISERKRAEEALRVSEANLATAVRLAHVGYWDWNVSTGALKWTQEIYRMFGIRDDSVTPSHELFLGRVVPGDAEYVRGEFDRALNGAESCNVEFRFRHPDDPEERYASAFGHVYRDSNGRPVRVAGAIQDITDRKRSELERKALEERMLQAQKMESLGVLAGGIAHDFNNLLASILGNADLALWDLPAQSPARDHLLDIERASRRAADLCQQMLAYSGKSQRRVQEIDLSGIVREMTQLLEVSISKRAALRYHLSTQLPAIAADPAQLRQVVMNLITNASEALEEQPGTITLVTDLLLCDRPYLDDCFLAEDLSAGEYVFIEVSDSGCGMDQQTIRRMFDPFFSNKFTGRGLGLAAVLGIVRGHQGAIHVRSAPGSGSTLRVLFPAVHVQKEPASGDAAADSRQDMVLLVEQEEPVRIVACRMLERMGLKVIAASCAGEALELLRNNAPAISCVVLDMNLRGVILDSFIGDLRSVRGDLRIILASGYGDQVQPRQFVAQGVAGFVQKPYLFKTLRAALQKAFETR